MKKPLSKKALKKKAWDEFSLYIRRKDADHNGFNFCFTCERQYHFKDLQAGHFVDGRGGSVLFNESLVRPQCMSCNVFKHGNKDAFAPKMIAEFGLKAVEELWRLKGKTVQLKTSDYEEIYNKYKRLNEKNEKNEEKGDK